MGLGAEGRSHKNAETIRPSIKKIKAEFSYKLKRPNGLKDKGQRYPFAQSNSLIIVKKRKYSQKLGAVDLSERGASEGLPAPSFRPYFPPNEFSAL